jgi:ferric-dicitrate binding protein FerR (iron transport regulator)
MWAAVAAEVEPATPRPAIYRSARHAPLHRELTRPHRHWWVSTGAIAAALVLTAAGTLWRLNTTSRTTPAHAEMREMATAKGQRASMQLSDGTRVLLGVDSKLRFAEAFGTRDREVFLTGEGYFVVTHNPNKPFVVHANGAVARDIGTAFDVRAYPGDRAIQVVVTTGQVALESGRLGAPRGPVLSRGELGRLERGSDHVTVHVVDTAAYLAWRDGRMIFHDTPLADVLAQLHRWYDVDITLADSSIGTRPLTATFQGESITEILDFKTVSLELQSVYTGRRITLFAKHVRN